MCRAGGCCLALQLASHDDETTIKFNHQNVLRSQGVTLCMASVLKHSFAARQSAAFSLVSPQNSSPIDNFEGGAPRKQHTDWGAWAKNSQGDSITLKFRVICSVMQHVASCTLCTHIQNARWLCRLDRQGNQGNVHMSRLQVSCIQSGTTFVEHILAVLLCWYDHGQFEDRSSNS